MVAPSSMPFSVIVGLGKTGFSCLQFLHQQGYPLAVVDSRENPPFLSQAKKQFPDVELSLGQLDEAVIGKAQQLIVSPGVALAEPVLANAINKGVPVLGDIEIFSQFAKAPILAITGSNGKTTVTALLGEMMARAGKKAIVCGNIGEPVLDALSQPVPDYYVMELSSFQLETTHSLNAKVATILNLSPDHMDRYASVEDYRAAKQRIYRHCETAVLNIDEPQNWQSLSLAMPTIGFTLQEPAPCEFGLHHEKDALFLAQGSQKLMCVDDMQLQGQHHYQNALACLAMGFVIGLPLEPMRETLRSFDGIAHRCQPVATIADVTWYNDSKATNLGATIAAIGTLSSQVSGQLHLIAGGDAKQADLSPLANWVSQHISTVYLFGKDAPYLEKLLSEVSDVKVVENLDQAVACAALRAKPHDAVLLSPACSSLDMFDNYEQRGETFAKAVNALQHD